MRIARLYLTLLLLTLWVTGSAQQRVLKYCEVTTHVGTFSTSKIKVELIMGNVDSLFSFKDSSVKESLMKVVTMPTAPDILNYMSSLGWSLAAVNTIPLSEYTFYYFSREFSENELQKR